MFAKAKNKLNKMISESILRCLRLNHKHICNLTKTHTITRCFFIFLLCNKRNKRRFFLAVATVLDVLKIYDQFLRRSYLYSFFLSLLLSLLEYFSWSMRYVSNVFNLKIYCNTYVYIFDLSVIESRVARCFMT